VRVLSLRENPAQAWADARQEVLDRLKAENDALLARLRAMEESGVRGGEGNAGAEVVPRESWDAVNEEKKELEGQLKQREKRLQRLQEVRRRLRSLGTGVF
jgi:mitotic spindle assembly checkpoint protein MAD1